MTTEKLSQSEKNIIFRTFISLEDLIVKVGSDNHILAKGLVNKGILKRKASRSKFYNTYILTRKGNMLANNWR
jgi:hypothetical protein